MNGMVCWLQTSLRRVFPASPPGPPAPLSLIVPRNYRTSFQACVRNTTDKRVNVKLSVIGPEGIGIRVRRVGYVPMAHHNTETAPEDLEGVGHIPGYVPDPLFDEDAACIGPLESHAFWVTVEIPADIEPGIHGLKVCFDIEGHEDEELVARFDVRPLVVHPPTDFPVLHWFYADALCDWYGVEPYEEGFWPIVEPYMRDVASHGSGQYVPIFTPPTDGVKRPHQLVRISVPSEGRYEFDFTDVRRWVRLARQCGAKYFQWTHLFWQWGCRYALRIYRSNQDPESLLWPPETEATSETYRSFLAQFLPEFHQFLQEEDLPGCSMFHVSDEPHGDHLEHYRKARAMLREIAPWMKVADALSDVRFGLEGITDMPIPIIITARQFKEAGIPSMVYYCCGPRGSYLNRLMDTPLARIAMSGWLFYHLGAKGFLHWGYNYWHKRMTQELIDPFTEQSGAAWPDWAYGDTFVVYPGRDGPVDSIRWEVFAESLQDIGFLQAAGVDPDDPLLEPLRDYNDFPKSEEWLLKARRKLFSTQCAVS